MARFRLSPWSPAGVASLVSLWIVLTGNFSFWTTFLGGQNSSAKEIGAALALAGLLLAATTSLLQLLAVARVHRIVWPAILLLTAITAHFVDHWGVLIDKGMLRNVLQTDFNESMDLLTTELALDVIIRGAIPALVVALWPMRKPSFLKDGSAVIGLVALTAGLVGIAALFYSVYAPTFRNYRELRYQLTPSNSIRATYGIVKPRRTTQAQREAVANDATRPTNDTALTLILVVGETARADNFSLGGYERPTNAPLNGLAVQYFESVRSCGTDTATSLPCMFSDLQGSAYSVERATARENILDVLKRTGVDVRWFENNSGCKGVCDRVPNFQLQALGVCAAQECRDTDFSSLLSSMTSPRSDSLVVLHQLGSHGPAYYKRYPEPPMFSPACETNRLQACDRQHVMNAYDNSIYFTSTALAEMIRSIDSRADRDRRAYALLYISDHGESLGENGVFLHGLPQFLAPHEQFHVPMLLWMNDRASARLAPVPGCLRASLKKDLSHHYVFHTLLGAYGVETSSYRQDLDLFADSQVARPCFPKGTQFLEEHRTERP